MPQHSRPVKRRSCSSVAVGQLVRGGASKGRRCCCCVSPTGCHLVMQETSPPFAPRAGRMTRRRWSTRWADDTRRRWSTRGADDTRRRCSAPRRARCSAAVKGIPPAARLQSDAFTAHTRRMQQDGEQRRERKSADINRGRAGQMTRDVVGLRAGQMTRDVVGLRAGQMTRDVVALRVGEHAARPRSKAFRQLRASSRMHSRPARAGCSRTVCNANQRILTDAAQQCRERIHNEF
jgi:hypothetical protein